MPDTPAEKPRVLVVDDDPAVRDSLRRSLEFNGYTVAIASDGVDALASIGRVAPDVVIMDVMMPRLDGIEATQIAAQGRQRRAHLGAHRPRRRGRPGQELRCRPTTTSAGRSRLRGLLARLRALLRRAVAQEASDETLQFSDLSMDLVTREVRRGDRLIELTRTEFTLLEMFMRRPRRVLERSFILEEVWGYDFPTDGQLVEVYVGYLRRKTEAESESRLLHTVRGVGYVLKEA